VAPERAVGGGQAVGIMVGQLGLTYPGVTTVTWHREGYEHLKTALAGHGDHWGGLVYSPGVQGLRAAHVRALDCRRWHSKT